MDDKLRRQAEFYAKLASVEKLEDLERSEKEQLMVDAVKAGLIHSVFARMTAITTSKDKRFFKSWGDDKPPGPWTMIYDVHPWARKIIGGFIDNGEVDMRDFEKKLTKDSLRPEVWVLDKTTRRVDYHPIVNGIIFSCMMDVIQADPFPFDRCPICKRVFLPGKNKKYCSKKCANKTIGPRTEYMKKYMADKRKAERGV